MIQISPMSPQPNLPQGETGYVVVKQDGSTVHASCWTDRAGGEAPSMFGIVGAARAINADGSPVLDGAGQLIHAEFTNSVEKTVLVVGGVVDEERRQGMHADAIRGAVEAMLAELALSQL